MNAENGCISNNVKSCRKNSNSNSHVYEFLSGKAKLPVNKFSVSRDAELDHKSQKMGL